MRWLITLFVPMVLLASCAPKEQIVLKGIKDIRMETGADKSAMLKADVVFYNPNHMRMKLKEIKVEVFVNGKKSAHADQALNSIIPANSLFSIPLEVHLSLKEFGLFDTVLSLLGGKKYEIVYTGYIRVKVHGISLKVPIAYKDEIRLKI